MLIKKEYKFYAGHRNQDLKDKCFRPHGHDYKVFVYFIVVRNGSISTLFGDFDAKIEPLLKNEFDHRFLLDKNDPLKKYFDLYEQETGEKLGYKLFDRPTSVENVCFELFRQCKKLQLSVDRIEVQETRTSTIIYTADDYGKDVLEFGNL